MNMISKVATSVVVVAASSVIIFGSTRADSMKPVQMAAIVVVAETPSVSVALNSAETPQAQLNDLQYN